MKKLIALLALLVAGSLGLVACGGDGSTSTSDSAAESSSPATTDGFNDADVEFAQAMIPHHQQAVEMSRLAATHADSPEVKQLAADIEAAQGPEIDTMTAWLQAWGKDAPSASETSTGGMGGGGGMDMHDGTHMDTADMPGMMSDADLNRLDEASGAAWDQMFLTMMIRHHEGAIEMAQTELANGQNPAAVALAQKVEDAQTAEIATMQDLLMS